MTDDTQTPEKELIDALALLAGKPWYDYETEVEAIKLIDQYATARVVEELEPLAVHTNRCDTVGAFQVQKAWHEDMTGKRTHIGIDPIECFDYLCTCGAIKATDRITHLKAKETP